MATEPVVLGDVAARAVPQRRWGLSAAGRSLLFALGLTVLLFGPVLALMVISYSDYPDHIRDAGALYDSGTLQNGRNLTIVYQLGVVAVRGLFPDGIVGLRLAGLGAAVAFYLAVMAVLHALLWRSAGLGAGRVPAHVARRVAWLALALMLVGPVTLLTLPWQNLYWGYIPLHSYHNPTMFVLKSVGLLLFVQAARAFWAQPDARAAWNIPLSFALVVVSAAAKPSLLTCLIPAAGVVGLVRMVRRQPMAWAHILLGLALPAALVLGYQYTGHYGAPEASAGIAFDPLAELRLRAAQGDAAAGALWLVPLKLALSCAFPLAVLAAYGRTAWQNPRVQLAWGTFMVGAGFAYLLAERGAAFGHYNFLWGGEIALFLLFVASVGVVVEQHVPQLRGARWATWPPRLRAVALVFGLHLLSGVVWYGIHLTQFSARLAWM